MVSLFILNPHEFYKRHFLTEISLVDPLIIDILGQTGTEESAMTIVKQKIRLHIYYWFQ